MQQSTKKTTKKPTIAFTSKCLPGECNICFPKVRPKLNWEFNLFWVFCSFNENWHSYSLSTIDLQKTNWTAGRVSLSVRAITSQPEGSDSITPDFRIESHESFEYDLNGGPVSR